MEESLHIEVHLYGKLRGAVGCRDAASDCVIPLSVSSGATIAEVLAQLGVELEHTSNIFLNSELSRPARQVNPGDRLGVFPDDMALLYKWYFAN